MLSLEPVVGSPVVSRMLTVGLLSFSGTGRAFHCCKLSLEPVVSLAAPSSNCACVVSLLYVVSRASCFSGSPVVSLRHASFHCCKLSLEPVVSLAAPSSHCGMRCTTSLFLWHCCVLLLSLEPVVSLAAPSSHCACVVSLLYVVSRVVSLETTYNSGSETRML